MIFEDRIEAARALIPYLKKYAGQEVVVLAIPRGGVPMGYVIASHFKWKLSLLLTKKIGHPMNKEYAIGAVSLDGRVLDHSHPDVPASYIESETEKIRELLRQRLVKFLGSESPVDLKNKVLIIVDDGIATGYTMKASVAILKNKNPSKIVIAVPVASPRILDALQKQVDDVIVLDSPESFRGVGQFYINFDEVTDEDVMYYLQKAK